MPAGRYQPLCQVSAGRDGIAYQAHDPLNGERVELRLLSVARSEEGRWPMLARRLRLAESFRHPLARAIRALHLDEDPPAVVLPPAEHLSLAAALDDALPLPPADVIILGQQLAGVLAAAHRFGLVHGWLSPSRVYCGQERQLCLDFTGIDAGEAETLSAGLDPRQLRRLDASCRPPRLDDPFNAEPEDDLGSLGSLLFWLLTSQPFSANDDAAFRLLDEHVERTASASPLVSLVGQMLSGDADERPTSRDVEERLHGLLDNSTATRIVNSATDAPLAVSCSATLARSPLAKTAAKMPAQLGRFRLLEKIGQGGMGVVYKAEDVSDGSIVAVKIPLDDINDDCGSRRRFHKEARLLAQVQNPYVARLLEVNEDAGFLYLAMEFVEGRNLRRVLDERGALDEPAALTVLADAARALVDAHQRGIIHRDIKLENMVLLDGGDGWRVKLLDFGLARQTVESESMRLTKTGAQLGTPLYMAPEQCLSEGRVDPRTDVYALGANLFHLLAGRPPFQGNSILSLLGQHCQEPAPPLARFKPDVSEGVCRLVAKALSKSPNDRYADAAAMLLDLERLLRGEPTGIAIHPRLPAHDPRRVFSFDWSWELESSPEQLWPFVSNTERLNRAARLPAVHYGLRPDPRGGTHRFAQFHKAGIVFAWEEHPFEWIEGRRMGVLRAYHRGPLKWLISQVELTPRPGGGTLLSHQIRVEPIGLLGRVLAAIEVGIKTRRALERVYLRMDAALTMAASGSTVVDAFEEPAQLPRGGREQMERLLDKLIAQGIEPSVAEALGEFLVHAPVQEVARIRPLALAERLKLPAEAVVAACLHGAREGLLTLYWDIICPLCRIPARTKDTLRELSRHNRCEACNVDFELDFAHSVELIFRVHPSLRDCEVGAYCAGGPAHSPHVVAQVRVSAGERMELSLHLAEGSYRLRGPQLAYNVDFRVHPAARATRWELDLNRGPGLDLPRTLKIGGQTLVLNNDGEHEILVRVERTAARADALTAARASSSPLFRELFPREVLSAGQLISIANVTFLVTELEQAGDLYRTLGDSQTFVVIHQHLRRQEEHIQRESGSVVKVVGEGLLAVFDDTVAAVRVARELQERSANGLTGPALSLRVGVHRGPALVSTVNDRVDYFGAAVKLAMQLPRHAGDGEVLLGESVAGDPHVAAWVHGRRIENELFTIHPAGLADCRVQRLRLPEQTKPASPQRQQG